MRADTPDRDADSHAGRHGDCVIEWPPELNGSNKQGWYISVDNIDTIFGPFATSQAAFGKIVEMIDKIIQQEYGNEERTTQRH